LFSTKTLALLGCTAVLSLAAEAALAGPMVIRSSGPSATTYPVGKPLAANMQLALKAGDVVTILDAGGTRVLKGPGSVAVAGSGEATGSGFSQLIANTGARQSRTGATRSAIGGGPARSPNVWYVDASKSGAQCLVDAASAVVWRPDGAAAGSVKLTGKSDGKSVDLAFRAGHTVRAWPAELPLVDGGDYDLAIDGAASPVSIKAIMVGAAAESLDGVATMLIAKGCANQLDVLADGALQAQPVDVAHR
jgi:hypothetical protein